MQALLKVKWDCTSVLPFRSELPFVVEILHVDHIALVVVYNNLTCMFFFLQKPFTLYYYCTAKLCTTIKKTSSHMKLTEGLI